MNHPSVSIILSTNRDVAHLGDFLSSLESALEHEALLEVLIIANGETASQSISQIPEWIGRQQKVTLIHEPIESLLAARHRGAQESSGEILSFLDDDILLSDAWFFNLIEVFSNPKVAFAGGPSLPIWEKQPPTWVAGLNRPRAMGQVLLPYLSLIDLGVPEVFPVDPTLIWGLNFSIRRNVFFQSGGFNPDMLPKSRQMFQGDGETGLALKLQRSGFEGGYFSGLKVFHVIPESRLTPDYLKKRAFYDGVAVEFTKLRSTALGLSHVDSESSGLRLFRNMLERAEALWFPLIPPWFEARSFRVLKQKHFWLGRLFLRKQFNSSAVVRSWVTRDNYLDWRHPSLKTNE